MHFVINNVRRILGLPELIFIDRKKLIKDLEDVSGPSSEGLEPGQFEKAVPRFASPDAIKYDTTFKRTQ